MVNFCNHLWWEFFECKTPTTFRASLTSCWFAKNHLVQMEKVFMCCEMLWGMAWLSFISRFRLSLHVLATSPVMRMTCTPNSPNQKHVKESWIVFWVHLPMGHLNGRVAKRVGTSSAHMKPEFGSWTFTNKSWLEYLNASKTKSPSVLS